jgi:hypothetical protein
MIQSLKAPAVALAALWMLSAPTARADDILWAAIGYNPTSGHAEAVWGRGSRDEADVDAVTDCNKHDGFSDCVLAAVGPCVSLATDPDPNNNAPYAGGRGWTQSEADMEAMSKALSGWTIQMHHCGTDPARSSVPGQSNGA